MSAFVNCDHCTSRTDHNGLRQWFTLKVENGNPRLMRERHACSPHCLRTLAESLAEKCDGGRDTIFQYEPLP